MVCTHATFRFAFEKFGVEAFDDRLIAVDEFHHVSVSEDNKLGEFVRELIERDQAHMIAMTGSYFRGDAAAVLMPEDERRFETVTYTYYEQLGGYKYLKKLDIGYYFYSGSYVDDLPKVLDENEKTIIHIPNVNSRESTQDKHKEVEHILETLGEWQGIECSMSRTGCCYDNAVMERFFWSLKHEWTKFETFADLRDAELSVFQYIETFYNSARIHQTLGYKTPNEFEDLHRMNLSS
ncbi:integrase core domain-containing protein [Neorhodopirellula pilleata]|nr:integrase core domain-containing protein [Neorhodopirellula pilleata]